MCLGKEKVGHLRQESGADKLSGADEGEDRAGQALHPSPLVWQAKCTRGGAVGSTVPALTELTV